MYGVKSKLNQPTTRTEQQKPFQRSISVFISINSHWYFNLVLIYLEVNSFLMHNRLFFAQHVLMLHAEYEMRYILI